TLTASEILIPESSDRRTATKILGGGRVKEQGCYFLAPTLHNIGNLKCFDSAIDSVLVNENQTHLPSFNASCAIGVYLLHLISKSIAIPDGAQSVWHLRGRSCLQEIADPYLIKLRAKV